MPGWFPLHPVGTAAATEVSLGEGDIGPLPLNKIPAPAMGPFKPVPGYLCGVANVLYDMLATLSAGSMHVLPVLGLLGLSPV